MAEETKFIHVREHKKADKSVLLEIELRNEKKLNVLNQEIIFSLNKTLRKWRDRSDLSLVFIHSAGERAFCAGGDVKEICLKIEEYKKEGKDPVLVGYDFFKTEYETDLMLYHFPKPVVLWGSGIVMGGGLGLFMASSYPIVTESSLIAMPEVSIGFFPDVGASFFLNQMPGHLGYYLALTACRLNAREASFLKMTKWAFSSKDKGRFFQFLKEGSFKDKEEFSRKFKDFYKKPDFLDEQSCWIRDHQKDIEKLFKSKDLSSFSKSLKAFEKEDKKWMKNRENFLKASPTSLALIFEQLKRAKAQDLKALFEMETVMAFRMCEASDFFEGVRTLLIDKRGDPKWRPSRLEELQDSEIQAYFEPKKHWDISLKL